MIDGHQLNYSKPRFPHFLIFGKLYYIIFSIYGLNGEVILVQPEQIRDIDTTGPFFTLPNEENMTKIYMNVNGQENGRILGFSSDKIMEAGTRMGVCGVMDATFKVLDIFLIFAPVLLMMYYWTLLSISNICHSAFNDVLLVT